MWTNPSPGPTWPSSNPSLLGSLGLRGLALTLALFGLEQRQFVTHAGP